MQPNVVLHQASQTSGSFTLTSPDMMTQVEGCIPLWAHACVMHIHVTVSTVLCWLCKAGHSQVDAGGPKVAREARKVSLGEARPHATGGITNVQRAVEGVGIAVPGIRRIGVVPRRGAFSTNEVLQAM